MTIIQASGGQFIVEKFEPFSENPSEIVYLRLRFEAYASVDATHIGFVQVARVLVGGKPWVPNAVIAARSIPAGDPDVGASVDCEDDDCNPIYGLTLPSGLVHGTSLIQGEILPGFEVVIGRHRFGGGEETVDALLEDHPQVPMSEGNCSMVFETAALVLAGPQANRYLGAIRWTWARTNGVITTPTPTPPPTIVEKGVSRMFRRAVQCWNSSATATGVLRLPW